MISLSSAVKKKIIAWIMVIFFIFSSLFIFNTVRAIPVEEVVNIPTALKYLLDKAGSIFFQGAGRKIINDFAYDAATYIGAGGRGQKALFIKEKWGDHWQDIADKAAGDFIESFAKSVVSDIASKNKNKGLDQTQCHNAYTACIEKAETNSTNNGLGDVNAYEVAATSCKNQWDKCLDANMTGADKRQDCEDAVKMCKDACNAGSPGLIGPQENSAECVANCETVYNFCWSKAQTAQDAPIFNAKNSPLANIDICNPSLDVAIRINFGLTIDYNQKKNIPYSVNCSFSEMVNNWKDEADRQKAIYTDKDYLKKLSRSFSPGANDLSVALSINSSFGDYRSGKVTVAKDETIGGGGWLDIRDLSGGLLGTPEQAKSRQQLTDQALWNNLGKVTGDILVDAANIFINQLMITGWQNLTGSLVDNTKSSSPTSYWSTSATGRKAIENKISQIKEPSYADGGRLNILADLITCANPANPGPTNCVIDANFSNAITNKMTVAKAMESGSLQKDWPFGFDNNGQEKLQYNQGYPYRSMLILRKYRILPVGWELAAQKIEQMYLDKAAGTLKKDGKNKLQDDFIDGSLKDGVSLEDMVSCFDFDVTNDRQGPDKYNSYGQAWCAGLVDPNWVLKLPDYFCGRQGYGPELVQDYSINETGQKSCGMMNQQSGIIGRVQVDGAYKNCNVDKDCCTRLENVSNGTLTRSQKPEIACSATCSYTEAKLTFARSEKYCADDQSCIKEDKSGKCLAYGYCTQERRQWVFDQKGQDQVCEPYMNTCKSYKLGSTNVSYLENTLDFNNCNASNSGCRAYSTTGDYNIGSGAMSWNDDPRIYFNGRVKPCDQRNEGCRQLLRAQVDSGVNLIADGDFEAGDTSRWAKPNFGTVYNSSDTSFDQNFVSAGAGSLYVGSNNLGVYFGSGDKSLLPKGFEFEIDQGYTLSASIYVESGTVTLGIGDETNNNYRTIEATAQGWNEYALTVDNDFTLQANSLVIRGIGSSSFYIDNVKFEIGTSNGFSAYGASGQVYQKVLPDYLTQQCYVNPPTDYSLKSDAPAICSTFVRRCNKDEVGCNLFTDIITKDQTAAKVKPKDVCPNECVGYDKFIQQTNIFNSARLEHFIPRTAKTCDAKVEGCSKFVNLDKVPEGGEENEYYLDFRRCTKPGDTCDDYITWEGSDVSGYQITTFKLEKNTETTQNQPKTVVDINQLDDHDSNANGDDLCSETIFKLPADHPLANPDCRQFFGKDGSISYHLYSKTVVCVDECFYYRQVDTNIDQLITDVDTCNKAIDNGANPKKGKWLDDIDQCAVCLNDGVWDDNHNSCVFRAWPNESITCERAEVGCSKYIGDTGHNVKIIFNDVFESNNSANWNDGGTIDAQVTTDALAVGGHSIQPSASILSKKINTNIKPGKKYILTFMARRRDQSAQINSISMTYNQAGASVVAEFTNGGQGLSLTNKWQTYKFSVDNVSGNGTAVSVDFKGLTGPDQLRLDNIKLIEVEDVYYLIRDSWQTPATCDQDHRGRPFPFYMSGCRAYTDMNKSPINLRSFDQLCQDSAAGCELMVDTFNSSAYASSTTNGITTKADEMAYVVYDTKKSCDAGLKGCQYLGKANRIGSYANVYLLNNPDTYSEILCAKNALFCETWADQATGNNVYFKDPGENVCEYLQQADGSEGWYTQKQQKCFSTTTCDPTDIASKVVCEASGMTCLTDETGASFCSDGAKCSGQSDCGTTAVCKYSASTKCETNYHKTIGLGVADGKLQPLGMADTLDGKNYGNAGLCQSDNAGCTEYIDPESVFNFDLWQGIDPVAPATPTVFNVSIRPDTLYILKSGSVPGAKVIIDCGLDWGIYALNHQNNELPLQSFISKIEVKPETIDGKTVAFSQEFYVHRFNDAVTTDDVLCTLTSDKEGSEGSLREAAVAYRLKDSLKKETPTTVSFNEGKILFNERSQNGAFKKLLTYSTLLTPENSAPGSVPNQPTTNGLSVALYNNANALMKVDPDRVCDQWLSCKTYIFNPLKADERICVERALCDRLNKANECSHFIKYQPTSGDMPVNQMYGQTGDADVTLTTGELSNLSGYSLVDYAGSNKLMDYYHLAGMKEVGGPKIKMDGSFEGKTTTGFKNAGSNADVIVINDPKVIEKELGLEAYRYVPDGQAVGKTSGNSYMYLSNPGTGEMIISMKVFLRTGSKASLRIGSNDNKSCPLSNPACFNDNIEIENIAGQNGIIAQVNKSGKWVDLIGRFELSNSYGSNRDIKVWLIANGLVYFDDLKIEPALAYRDDNAKSVNKQQYLHGACRLFPQRDSTACDYFDGSGLRRKGWSGYCLQYDPRNSTQCLQWFPIDRIAGDEFEEGASLSIDKDLYYCTYAEDQCNKDNPVQPEFGCKTFIKVNKDKYWHDRIAEGSPYVLAPGIFSDSPKLFVDFGIDNPAQSKPGGIVLFENGLDWTQGSGFYGALSSRDSVEILTAPYSTGVETVGGSKRLLPIVPFSGASRGGWTLNYPDSRTDEFICKATVNKEQKDAPIAMSSNTLEANAVQPVPNNLKYDLCTVGAVGQLKLSWGNIFDSNMTPVFNQYCASPDNYDWTLRSSWPCLKSNRSDKCGGRGITTYIPCGSTSGDDPKCMITPNYMMKCDKKLCDTCESSGDEVQARAGLITKNGVTTEGAWELECRDWAKDGRDSVCLFDCYNHTKSYSIGKSYQESYYALQRLFTDIDGFYEWDNGLYKKTARVPNGVLQPMTACPGGVRPVFNNSRKTDDYCFVRPTVANVEVSPKKIKKQGYVTLSFTSNVDPEQLPLRRVEIDMGVKKLNGDPIIKTFNLNIFDRRDKNNPHKFLLTYDTSEIQMSGNAITVYPSVRVYDNWYDAGSVVDGNGGEMFSNASLSIEGLELTK